MAMQIPRRIYPEISSQDALRGGAQRAWAGVPPVGRAERVCDRGRTCPARSRAYVDQCSTEAGRFQRGGLSEGKECDPRSTACIEEAAQLRGTASVGEGLLRGYGRPGHGKNPTLYPGTGGRGQAVGPTRTTLPLNIQ